MGGGVGLFFGASTRLPASDFLAPWLLDSLAPRLLGSLAPRLLGSSAPRLLGSLAPWLLGSSARWLPSWFQTCRLSAERVVKRRF